MSQRFGKLVALLKKLFQLDQPDLDFGFYRIMHAKSAEVSQFLDKDLLPQVQAAFAQYQSADKAAMEKELAELVAGIEAADMSPEDSPKVKELRARLVNEAVDLDALEGEVYDHLYRFFRRYYSEGDFLSKRVYKEGVYAIPYEGEEVKLYWANHDQYYIKTSEYLRDYAFRLRPDDEKNPMRVHFKLVDAAEGEHGNVKETSKRVFVLAGHDFIAEEDGDLLIRFEYRPATLGDWPEEEREGKKKPPAQKDLIAAAEARVLAVTDAALAPWIGALRLPHVKSDGERADYSRLRANLNRYTARNTFDYFIHKDLGGFLRRELDFYIKNEVMHLDDIENETAPRVEQVLSKIKVIRKIAGKIIDFLAQLEDFQKKLWLKKKFVVETFWCITVGTILKMEDEAEREALLAEIAANDAQREEWERLGFLTTEGTEDTEGRSEQKELFAERSSADPAVQFLVDRPTLVVDTRHFGETFTVRLLEAVGNIDEQTDGLLIHSENFHALSLMQARYRERVKCIYIDPPYNTGKDSFPYKDGYQHGTWLAMMLDRLLLVAELMPRDGAFLSSIDRNELRHLSWLLGEVLGANNEVGTIVWRNARDNNPTRLAIEHEYVACYVKDNASAEPVWKNDFADAKETLLEEYRRLRDRGLGPDAIQVQLRRFIKDNAAVLAEVDRYKFVDEHGVYTGSQSVHNPHPGGYEYEVIHPTTGRPMRMPANGYRFPETTMRRAFIEKDRLIYGPDENRIVQIKLYLQDFKDSFRSVLDLDGRLGAYALQAQFGTNGELFENPKPPQLLRRLLSFSAAPNSTVLDYFAGSGTAGQSVIEIARATGTPMRFILVEMGDYFDTVLLPRIKKVTFTPEWKDGKPKRLATAEEAERSPRVVKVIRLESYEDTLNNLELKRTKAQEQLLFSPEAGGEGGLREQYMLRYMLEVESRGSQSLLSIAAFTDPTAYRLKVKIPGSDESREVNVDLVETFSYLIGLTVEHMAAAQRVTAAFRRDDDPDLPEDAPRRLLLDRRIRTAEDGRWWFRTVSGTTPDGRKTLVIWRNRPGGLCAEASAQAGEEPEGIEQDNLVLDEWFQKQGYSSKDSEFDLIYVNGDNNLENLKAPDDTWKVRLIEEDFHRLMFDVRDA